MYLKNFQLNNFCKMTNDQCVELFNKNKADKICDRKLIVNLVLNL